MNNHFATAIWIAISVAAMFAVAKGISGSKYVCDKCGASRKYYGYYVFTTPNNYCPVHKSKLILQK